MTTSSTPSQRTCWHCGKPVEGRADKKFCRSACKASYSRQQQASVTDSVAEPPSRPQSLSRPTALAAMDWQTRCQEAEAALLAYQQQVAHEREVATAYAQEYVRLDQLLCRYSQAGWTMPTLYDALSQLSATIRSFQQHPNLADPLHVAHRHLAELHFIENQLQRDSTWLLEHKQPAQVP